MTCLDHKYDSKVITQLYYCAHAYLFIKVARFNHLPVKVVACASFISCYFFVLCITCACIGDVELLMNMRNDPYEQKTVDVIENTR